jgi:hypothetical protein
VSASWTEDFFKTQIGPLATIRSCTAPGCNFTVKVKKGNPSVGRGYGMREGNKARGKIIQHIKQDHPELEPKP